MFKRLLFIFASLFFINLAVAQPYEQTRILHEKDVKTGASQINQYLPLLTGKRVAVIANVTSLINKTHLVDTLLALKVKRLVFRVI